MPTTCYKLLFFLVGLLLALQVSGQADTLFIGAKEKKIDLLPFLRVYSTPEYITPETALQAIEDKGYKIEKATIGFTRDTYWATFNLKNASTSPIHYMLEVSNPQIDCLQVYTFSKDKISTWALTGDAFPFQRRLVKHRNFILPITLQPDEHKSVLLKIEKRNSSLNFPVFLWNEADYHHKDYVENLGYGLYAGLILLCALYSLLIFTFLRGPIYLWYFLWIVSSGAFVFTALGFSHQFLYPHAHDLNSIFRIIVEVVNLVAFLQFSQKFLRMEEYTPVVSKIIHGITVFIVAISIPLPFKPAVYFEYSHLLLPFLNGITILSLVIIIYSSVASYKSQRTIILYYFSAFTALIVGGMFVLAIEFGVVAAEQVPVNPFMVGSVLEFLIFSVGLTYQVKKIYDERNLLSFKFAQQQKELLKAYVDGVERERERISRELHDDIGSRLSTLKRFFTGKTDNAVTHQVQEQIEILYDDVRNMSHQLMPASLKISGLKNKVFELAAELENRNHIQVDIQFYDFPENLSDEMTVHIYRILQEAFTNISKHAQATVVDLQFFGHEDELVITIEDNGKGFSNSEGPGIGLQNMQARSESIQGSIEINSYPGRGTQVLLRIPKTQEKKENQ